MPYSPFVIQCTISTRTHNSNAAPHGQTLLQTSAAIATATATIKRIAHLLRRTIRQWDLRDTQL